MTPDYYLELIQAQPNNHRHYVALGDLYFDAKDYPKAIIYFEKAIEIGTLNDYAGERLELASKRVIRYYLKILRQNPNQPEIYLKLGQAYGEVWNKKKAIKAYLKAAELDPENGMGYIYVGDIYSKMGRKHYEKAIEYYQKAMDINPDDIDLYYNIGEMHFNLAAYHKAIEYFQKVLAMNSNRADAYMSIAWIYYYNLKQYELAIEYYRRGLDLKQTAIPMEKACYNIGRSFFRLKHYIECIPYFKKALEINPTYLALYAHYFLGVSFYETGQYEKGIQAYTKAAKFDKKDADIYFGLGLIYSKQGELEKMVQAYLEALRCSSKIIGPNLNLGYYYIKKGQFDIASNYLSKEEALKGTTLKMVYMNIGNIHLLQKSKAAIKWYRKSLTLYDNKQSFLIGMQDNYTELNMKKRGISKQQFSELIKKLNRSL